MKLQQRHHLYNSSQGKEKDVTFMQFNSLGTISALICWIYEFCIPTNALLCSQKSRISYYLWLHAFVWYRKLYWSKAINIQRIGQSDDLLVYIKALMFLVASISKVIFWYQ